MKKETETGAESRRAGQKRERKTEKEAGIYLAESF